MTGSGSKHMNVVSNPYIFNIKNDYNSKAKINIAFTSQSWTSSGTYTWIAPFTGTATVCVIGGGGGGGGGGSNTSHISAGNGSQSSFDNIIATGGSARVRNSENISKGNGGVPNGRTGETNNAAKVSYGGQGFSLAKNLTNGSYGSGGSAKGILFGKSASRGSGGCNISQINVVKGQNYQIIVGTSGRGADDGSSSSSYANNGNTGAVGIWKE